MKNDFQGHLSPEEEVYRRASSDKNFQPYWLKYFKPGNEALLRALSPAQRRELEAQMVADYEDYIAKVLETSDDNLST